MISVQEALRLCLDSVRSMPPESVPTHDALHRVLTEPVCAQIPFPPWDNSAMDGYALIAEDTETLPDEGDLDACGTPSKQGSDFIRLTITETIAAGTVGEQTVEPGHAARIMTGAPIPTGADAVVMREKTTESASYVDVHKRTVAGQNIRRAGENVSAGAQVLAPGTVLTPAALGLCAAAGRSSISVARQPRVSILSTGDEIVPPGEPLRPGQIHSSNTHALCGWVREAGGIPIDLGIVGDNLAAMRKALRNATKADLVISTGGVSVGDFDVVRQAMDDLGADMHFWKIKMKPGKPLAFGMIEGTPTFGLPGNPVSCQVGFLQFVRPWIRMALGDRKPFLPVTRALFEGSFRKKAGRAELARVQVRMTPDGITASLAGKQGSGNQMSMALANGLLLLSESECTLQKGDPVQVQMFGPLLQPSEQAGFPW